MRWMPSQEDRGQELTWGELLVSVALGLENTPMSSTQTDIYRHPEVEARVRTAYDPSWL